MKAGSAGRAQPSKARPTSAPGETTSAGAARATAADRLGARDWRPAAALALALVALAWLAWMNRNLVDDAFIGFRYAEHFANGQGLVWNPGERVEGFTSSFLWVVLLGLFLKAGFAPVPITFALNIGFLVAALALFYAVARRVLGSPWHALAAVVILGTNFTFSSSGTLGIGTHLQSDFLLASLLALLLYDDDPDRRPLLALAAFSVFAAIAVLVRVDSLLPVGILYVAAIYLLFGASRRPGDLGLRCTALFVPAAVLLVAWGYWKWEYYGTILPNTFWIKVPGLSATWAGLYYVYAFLFSYLFVVQIPVVLAALRHLRPGADWVILASIAIIVSWFAYVIRIGGDFIEFRFMSCILPFLVLTIYWSILEVCTSATLRVALLAMLVLGSIHHQLFFGTFLYANCVYRPSLTILKVPPPSANSPMLWSELESGEFLGRAFDYDPSVRIAVGAAGVIPYYSKAWVLDILGLSDPWIAQNGHPLRFERFIAGFNPGHVRIAPMRHVVDRGVNLFLGVGVLTRDDVVASVRSLQDLLAAMFLEDESILAVQMRASGADFPADAQVVEIPVRPGYKMLAIYLNRSEHVDRVIADQGWRTYPLHDLQGA